MINDLLPALRAGRGGARSRSTSYYTSVVTNNNYMLLTSLIMIKGVALRLDEWAKMRNIVETIDDNHPSLASAIPCYLQEDHQNQMGV